MTDREQEALAADLDEELSDVANLLGKDRVLDIASALLAKGYHRAPEPPADVREALANMPTHVDENGVRFGRLGERTADFFLSRFRVVPLGTEPDEDAREAVHDAIWTALEPRLEDVIHFEMELNATVRTEYDARTDGTRVWAEAS